MLWKHIHVNNAPNDRITYETLKEMLKRVSSGKLTTGEVFDVSGIYTLLELLNTSHSTQVYIMVVTVIGLVCNNEGLHRFLMKKNVLKSLMVVMTRDVPELNMYSPQASLQLQLYEHMLSLLLYFSTGPNATKEECFYEGVVGNIIGLLANKLKTGGILYGYNEASISHMTELVHRKLCIAKINPVSDQKEVGNQQPNCKESATPHDLIINKHIGKVSRIVNNNLKINKTYYDVDLFDTSLEAADLNIAEELISSNSAWPDRRVMTGVSSNNKATNPTAPSEPEETIWQDVFISHVISPEYFFAHVGTDSLELVKQGIERVPAEKRQYLKHAHTGVFVCCDSTQCGYYRGQVLRLTGEEEELCEVYALDHGFIAQVEYSKLFLLTAAMGIGNIPPQAVLCRLKGVTEKFLHSQLAEEALAVLVNLSSLEKSVSHFEKKSLLGDLHYIAQCPDPSMTGRVFRIFCNLCRSENVRESMGRHGVIATILDSCITYSKDLRSPEKQAVLESGLTLLRNLFCNCDRNKQRFTELKGVEVLLPLGKDSVPVAVRRPCLRALRMLIGGELIANIIPREQRARHNVVVSNIVRGHQKAAETSGPVQRSIYQQRGVREARPAPADADRGPENKHRQVHTRDHIPDDEESCIISVIKATTTNNLAEKPDLVDQSESSSDNNTDLEDKGGSSKCDESAGKSLYSSKTREARERKQQIESLSARPRSRTRSLGRPPLDDERNKLVQAKLDKEDDTSDDDFDDALYDMGDNNSGDSDVELDNNVHANGPRKIVIINTVTLYREQFGVKYFVQGTRVPFCHDETHEFRTIKYVSHVPQNVIFKIVCSFLNNRKDSSLYFGIDHESTVFGTKINRDQRDEFRIGIDRIFTNNLRPFLTKRQYDMTFTPVVHYKDHTDREKRRAIPDLYVIEIKIKANNDNKVYSTTDNEAYFRVGDESVLKTAQHRHNLVVKEKEESILKEIERLQSVKQILKKLRPNSGNSQDDLPPVDVSDSLTNSYYTTDDESSSDDENTANCSVKVVNNATLYIHYKKSQATKYMVKGTRVGFHCDETHEISTSRSINSISSEDFTQIVCGFLNNRVGGSIYFGIDSQSTVFGINTDKKERDAFRIGLHGIFTNRLHPVVTEQQYELEFTPVVYYKDHHDCEKRQVIPDLFVVEINVKPTDDQTLYSKVEYDLAYFRNGVKTNPASANERHINVVEEQEEKYLMQIKRLQLLHSEILRGPQAK